MIPASWAQQQTKLFFDSRTSPTQSQCDQIALSISGASKVRPVDNPGSLSYTVVCSDCPGPRGELIMSFREPGGRLDDRMVDLARNVHGDLVPKSTCHGNVEGADPRLSIYSMNYLPGSALVEVQSTETDMSREEEAKHERLIRDLARYFARCWSSPQPADPQDQLARRERIRSQLNKLIRVLPPDTLSESTLPGLITSLDSLFTQHHPQALTHGDFSITNILIKEETFDITGIVGWSLASIMPFGADLDILFLTTGFMTLDGWHDYSCKPRLLRAFWDEFWNVSNIGEEEENRKNIKTSAEAAAKISAVLKLAFRRNPDGSPSDHVLVSGSKMEQLEAWVDK